MLFFDQIVNIYVVVSLGFLLVWSWTAEWRVKKKARELAGKLAEREKQLIYAASDPIVVLDREGVFLSVNAASVRLFKYPVEQILGKKFTQVSLFTPQYLETAKMYFKEITEGNRGPFEIEMVDKDGERVVVEVKVSPVMEMKKVVAYQMLIRDVTERVRLTEVYLKEQQKARTYLDLAGVMMVSIDLDQTVVLINKRGLEILGYTEAEVIGSNWFETFIPKEKRKRVRDTFDQLVKGRIDPREAELFENEVLTKSGERRLIRFHNTLVKDTNQKLIGTLSSGEDITEERKAQKALNAAKALDEALLEAIPEGVVAVDMDSKIIFLNTEARRLLESQVYFKTKLKPEGQNLTKLLRLMNEEGHMIAQKKRPVIEAMAKARLRSSTDLYIKTTGGKLAPLSVMAAPIIEEGKVMGGVTVMRDITKEKTVDRAKTEFVSIASHQLRTPLSVISWYTELLKDKSIGNLNENQTKYVETIYSSCMRMIELVNALLNVSRIELGSVAIEPHLSDLGQVVDEIVDELKPKWLIKKQKVVRKYALHLPRIEIDKRLLMIVLQNLVSNAIKYTSVGGKIMVKMKKNDGEIEISVIDNGSGIPIHDQNFIFTKLFRADNAKEVDPEGTGLGLYVAKSVVDTYGGKIWFESKEGKGSRFHFTIPIQGMKKKEGAKTLI